MRLSIFPRLLVGLAVFAGGQALFAQDPIVAPEGIPVESDWLYRQHYEQVQGIMNLPDIGEREKRLEAYFKKLNPKAKIYQYMPGFFGQIVQAYQKAGQTTQANALTEKMAKMFPNSSAAVGKGFQEAFDAKNYPKAIELGEKIYASNPNPQVAVMLAQSYIATKNNPKAIEYSKKVIDSLGPKKAISFVVWLGDYYAGQNDRATALTYYNQMLEAYPQGTPEGWEASQWNQKKAAIYDLRATQAYTNKDYASAVNNYAELLKYYPQNDAAYFYMGLSYWRLKDLDQAMEAFARATVIGKSNSAKAREYLEQLYKAGNEGSLDGLDDVLAKAKIAVNM